MRVSVWHELLTYVSSSSEERIEENNAERKIKVNSEESVHGRNEQENKWVFKRKGLRDLCSTDPLECKA